MRQELVNGIKEAGFELYMRNLNDRYGYYTDGSNIGYIQESWSGNYDLSTVHVPNLDSGSGYQVERGGNDYLTKEILQRAFAIQPAGFYGPRPRKWKDWAAFNNADSWNKQLAKV